jgi:hypothetical protein
VFWFSLQFLSETFLIIRRTERDIIINLHRSSYKVPVISNFIKVRPLGSELFHADEQTYTTKLIVAFRSFPNAYKKDSTTEFWVGLISVFWCRIVSTKSLKTAHLFRETFLFHQKMARYRLTYSSPYVLSESHKLCLTCNVSGTEQCDTELVGYDFKIQSCQKRYNILKKQLTSNYLLVNKHSFWPLNNSLVAIKIKNSPLTRLEKPLKTRLVFSSLELRWCWSIHQSSAPVCV